MNVQDITGGSTWAIAAAAFSNPMYLSAPLGKTGNADSTGFQITPGAAVVIGFQGTYTGQTVAHEQTMDPTGATGWFAVSGAPSTGGTAVSTGATSGVSYVFTCIGVLHRITVTALSTGAIEARVRLESEAISSSSGGGSGGGGDVNLTQVASSAVTAGAGPVAAGTQRTTLASDDPAVVSLAALVAASTAVGPVLAPSASTLISGAITTAIANTTDTLLLAAPGASLYNYITTIIISNSSSVGTEVVIKDGLAGTVLMTIPAAASYGGATITLPVPLKQPTANTALYVANLTTLSSTKVSVVGYTGA